MTTDEIVVPTGTEAPAAETPIVKEEVLIAPQLSKVRQREQAISTRESAIAAKDAELAQREAALNLIKENPKEFLAKYGVTFEEFAQAYLNLEEVKPDPVSDLKKEVEALKNANAKEEEKQQNAQKAHEEAVFEHAKNVYLRSAKDFISSEANSENYEFTLAYGQENLILDTALEYFSLHGVLPVLSEVADSVEKHLSDQVAKVSNTKKIRKMLEPDAKTSPTLSLAKTLTNSAQTAVRPVASDPLAGLNRSQRVSRVAEMIQKGQLARS